MIQLGRTGVIIDQDEVGQLRSIYARNHCALLPGLLDASLLEFLARRLERQQWVRKVHGEIGAEDVLDDAVALSALDFVANTPAFLELVRRVSGRDEVRLFRGRVYRLTPGSADYDSWHSDVVEREPPRLVGMSINLGARAYTGGGCCSSVRRTPRKLPTRSPTGAGAMPPCSRYTPGSSIG